VWRDLQKRGDHALLWPEEQGVQELRHQEDHRD